MTPGAFVMPVEAFLSITFRGGRLAPVPTKPRLHLAGLLAAAPTPPESVDWYSRVDQWPMFMNDQIGNCVVEGTLVSAASASQGYRMAYSGPVLKLVFESGKQLTVTPNHAVLTPTGFRKARFLQKGDYAIGARRAKPLGASENIHFDQTPAPVEEVVASLFRRGARAGVVAKSSVPVSAVDFHGDERFVDGDVDVVRADSFLGRELDTSLSKPYRQNQIGAAGELKRHLHGLGSSLERRRIRRAPALGGVSRLGESFAFSLGHTRVAEADALSQRARRHAGLAQQTHEPGVGDASLLCKGDTPLTVLVTLKEGSQVERRILSAPIRANGIRPTTDLVASVAQPSDEGGATDAEFAANLLERHSGFVEADRLIDVQGETFHGYVYDLSTETRWYVANGILTHNCTEAMVGHTIQNTSTYGDGRTVTITDDDVLAAYERVSGYRQGHPETDQGAVLQDVFNDWRKTGVGGHKARAFGEVRVTSRDQIKTAINVFGALGLGLVVTQQMMDDFNAGRGWSRSGGQKLGGHAVVAVGYNPDGVYVVTWGEVILMTWAVFNRTVEEAWAAILDEWVNDTSTVSPLGDALYALGEDLADLTGGDNPFPEPGPTPDPTPTPEPSGCLGQLLGELRALVKKYERPTP